MSKGILIAGYYRSGTSALCGALARAGVTISNEASQNEHNPRGFYEIPELIALDQEVFTRLGRSWHDVRFLPQDWWLRGDMEHYRQQLVNQMRGRFGDAVLWGVKHPHLCRLFPLYRAAVETVTGALPGIVHIYRDPYEVAASQQRKNGLSRSHALLLWATHLVAAEAHARELARAHVTYADLLGEPGHLLRGIEQALGIELPARTPAALREIGAFLTADLRRSKALAREDTPGPLRRVVDEMWQAISDRDFSPAVWDGFRSRLTPQVDLLDEIARSGLGAVPGMGIGGFAATAVGAPGPDGAAPVQTPRHRLRPNDRTDEGARARLQHLLTGAPALPGVHVVVACSRGASAQLRLTLDSLRGQWQQAEAFTIVTDDPDVPDDDNVVNAEVGALGHALCTAAGAARAEYVAIVDAGDVLEPDAIARFALVLAGSRASAAYCDEIVDHPDQPWIRFKPAWDRERLRACPYVGGWVWYRVDALRELGGLKAAYPGAEEYELQLRLAEGGAEVARIPEALYVRAPDSRRDAVPLETALGSARRALAEHLGRCGVDAAIDEGAFVGAFRIRYAMPQTPPRACVVLDCDHADRERIHAALEAILGHTRLPVRVLLTATRGRLGPGAETYLAGIREQSETLGEKVRALDPAATRTDAFRAAIAAADSEAVVWMDARCEPSDPDWLGNLLVRLAQDAVGLVGARAVVPGGFGDSLVGPLVLGAGNGVGYLGIGRPPNDPGPGGWLAVDQRASGVAPPCLAARRSVLAELTPAELPGAYFWMDLCRQAGERGWQVLWTPWVSVSWRVPAASLAPDDRDAAAWIRGRWGAWDPWHHPALPITGDLLAPDDRIGLAAPAPADGADTLMTGDARDTGVAVDAARAVRASGAGSVSWVPDPVTEAEILRRAPARWIRVNPQQPVNDPALPYVALFTRPADTRDPEPVRSCMREAGRVFVTSPGLEQHVRKVAGARAEIELSRPRLSRRVWDKLRRNTAGHGNVRVLWVDEGTSPSWWTELMSAWADRVSWLVVQREGTLYRGPVARIDPPLDDDGWARELAASAPHILLRPAAGAGWPDRRLSLMAAAAGCALVVEEALDTPAELPAIRVPDRPAAWQKALERLLADPKELFELGARTREALPGIGWLEEHPPAWILADLPAPQPAPVG